MPTLLLNSTKESDLIKSIYPSIKQDITENKCYIITSSYHSSDGGGGSEVLGIFLSKEKAAKAFLTRVKNEFNAKNAEYAEEGEIYFEEEPELENWNTQYVFQCKNHLYDDYVWTLDQKTIGEIDLYEQ